MDNNNMNKFKDYPAIRNHKQSYNNVLTMKQNTVKYHKLLLLKNGVKAMSIARMSGNGDKM